MARAQEKITLNPTSMHHIYECDIDDSGLLRQIALLKKFKDGSICYIDVAPLHDIDKRRIKKIITSQHADKYELWELMSQSKLNNGMNALDFFHTNFAKVKRPLGAKASGPADTLESVSGAGVSDTMIGSNFVNPAEATLDQSTGSFLR